MNTPNNTPIKKSRGRPRIHEDNRALWRSNAKNWREKNPEKYLENAFRKREPIYCDVCEKMYCRKRYKEHLYKRNHLNAFLKKVDQKLENSQKVEDNENILQLPIAC